MIGVNCKFAYSLASPLTWVEITNVVEFEFPVLVADEVEKSVYGTSRLRRYEPGMEKVGNFTFTVLQDLGEAAKRVFRELRALRTNVWWLIEIPEVDDGTTFVGYHFQGRVASFEPSQPKDGEQTTRYVVMFDGDSIGESAAGASVI